MASLVFNNIVADPNVTNPTSLNLALTANGVGITFLEAGTTSVLFNAPTANGGNGLNGKYTGVTFVGNTTRINVDTALNNTVFALEKADNTSSIFTYNSAVPTGRVLTDNGYDSNGPEQRRLWNLNG
jgi:hypothetical protein